MAMSRLRQFGDVLVERFDAFVNSFEVAFNLFHVFGKAAFGLQEDAQTDAGTTTGGQNRTQNNNVIGHAHTFGRGNTTRSSGAMPSSTCQVSGMVAELYHAVYAVVPGARHGGFFLEGHTLVSIVLSSVMVDFMVCCAASSCVSVRPKSDPCSCSALSAFSRLICMHTPKGASRGQPSASHRS